MSLSSSDEAQLAALTGQLATDADARSVLGKATELLAEGYSRLGDLPSSVFDSADTQTAAQSLLDSVNAWVAKVYASIPDDDAALDSTTRAKVQSALEQSWNALQLVERLANETYWDFPGAMREVLQISGTYVGAATSAVASAVPTSIWIVAAVVLVAFLLLRSSV
jgi:hypothetical protein